MPVTAARVRAFAELSLELLREAGVSDADIIATYLDPHPYADSRMEADQVAATGAIYAPAAAVKAAMREILERTTAVA